MPSSRAAVDPAAAATEAFDREPRRVGPLLFFHGYLDNQVHLAALLVLPDDQAPPIVSVGPAIIAAEVLHRRRGLVVLRYRFSLPATGGDYRVGAQSFDVAGLPEGDLRLAYLSCNGQERGDDERRPEERNAMWQRLAQQHRSKPFHLLLQGGDQLYADEMLDAHPAVRQWADGEIADAEADVITSATERLHGYLMDRYLALYVQPTSAWLLARVPMLCMWDDHDICDGWGSLSVERMESPIGRVVFRAAREFFLLFQLGCPADDPPPICPDRTGTTLTWTVSLPGVLLIAPDLRSERQPERLLGPAGWAVFEEVLRTAADGHVFILSSVPVLGPRLSWVEAVMHYVPGAQKYEDDLRDQWQSRWHRDEWQRMLRVLLAAHEHGSPVTILSGEIHLATRCTMAARPAPLHQLIASGIAHPPPPRWYAALLGTLARLGETPLPSHPIQLHPLPGHRSIYKARRNYLTLERRAGAWTAAWELEHEGTTRPLTL